MIEIAFKCTAKELAGMLQELRTAEQTNVRPVLTPDATTANDLAKAFARNILFGTGKKS